MSTHEQFKDLGDQMADAADPTGQMSADGPDEFRDSNLTDDEKLSEAFGQLGETDSGQPGDTDTEADPDDQGQADAPVEGSR